MFNDKFAAFCCKILKAIVTIAWIGAIILAGIAVADIFGLVETGDVVW